METRQNWFSAEDIDAYGLLLLWCMKSITVLELYGIFFSSTYNTYVSLDFCLEK